MEFTYEVEFTLSNMSRWTGWDGGVDSYGSSVHRSSTLNLLISIVLSTAFRFFRCLQMMELVFGGHTRGAQLGSEIRL